MKMEGKCWRSISKGGFKWTCSKVLQGEQTADIDIMQEVQNWRQKGLACKIGAWMIVSWTAKHTSSFFKPCKIMNSNVLFVLQHVGPSQRASQDTVSTVIGAPSPPSSAAGGWEVAVSAWKKGQWIRVWLHWLDWLHWFTEVQWNRSPVKKCNFGTSWGVSRVRYFWRAIGLPSGPGELGLPVAGRCGSFDNGPRHRSRADLLSREDSEGFAGVTRLGHGVSGWKDDIGDIVCIYI